MSTIFAAAYADLYDELYATKDYARECDLIEDIFRRFGDDAVHRVLDLGCGTGNHALPLSRRGYAVTGVDQSVRMLRNASAKAADAGASVRWLKGDVRTVDAEGAFDAALLMFAVLGYQHTNSDVRATFSNIRRHLRPGGLLVFDAWYGPGVLTDPPANGERAIDTADGRIIRSVESTMDVRRHLCTVGYSLRRDSGESLGDETHVVRYFFPMELEMYLETSGFRLLNMGAFDAPMRQPAARDWNVLVVAQAV